MPHLGPPAEVLPLCCSPPAGEIIPVHSKASSSTYRGERLDTQTHADLLSTSGQLPLSAVPGLSPRPLLLGPLPVLLIRSLGDVLETSLQFSRTYARCGDRGRKVSRRTSGNSAARGSVMTYRPPAAASSRRPRWGSPCPRSRPRSRGGKGIIIQQRVVARTVGQSLASLIPTLSMRSACTP